MVQSTPTELSVLIVVKIFENLPILALLCIESFIVHRDLVSVLSWVDTTVQVTANWSLLIHQ